MKYGKLAIIGGNGKAGSYIAKKALEEGFQVRMLVRNPDKLTFTDERIEVVKGDARDTNSIRLLLSNCDFIINTLGQPVKEVPIYSTVTKSILTIMKELGIRRYIGVTGASLDVKGDQKTLINKIGAKIFRWIFTNMMADREKELEILSGSDVDWTLVRLPFILVAPSLGDIKESLTNTPGMKISNTDIANFLINQINDCQYVRKAPFISN
jgi:putative NADH-flavin reductase